MWFVKFIIHRLAACGSTNDAVRELAAAGAPEGTIVVADEQTAGRGTKGRAWHSPPGLGLYASLLLRPASGDLALLPIAAGIAARDAVEASHGIGARLRWPNDIVFDGRKLGGVLCESSMAGGLPELAVLGIGINVNHGPGDFPAELQETAISLGTALGRRADPGLLFDALLAAVDSCLDVLARGDVAGLVRSFNDHSALRPGDPVIVSSDALVRRFAYEGIGADGALLVRDDEGALHRFLSAEVRKAL
jgi:BirA family biotin operon repressor/biotin-[acetyl-CoA-carboxylase] ligase